MLERLQRLGDDVCNVFICCSSVSLQCLIKDILIQRYDCNKGYISEIRSMADYNAIKHELVIPPLIGDKRMVEVTVRGWGVKGLEPKEITEYALKGNSTLINLIWVSNYSDFKRLHNDAKLSGMGMHNAWFYLNKLEIRDFYYIMRYELGDISEYLTDDLTKYIAGNYLTEPESVFRLIKMLQSGMSFKTKNDILLAIGEGKSTTVSFVTNLLLLSYTTERGYRQKIRKLIKQLEGLSINKSWYGIQQEFIRIIDCFILIKQQMLMGYYTKYTKTVPHYADVGYIQKCAAYDWVLFDNATMGDLLTLRRLAGVKKEKQFTDMQLHLMEVIYSFGEYKKNG